MTCNEFADLIDKIASEKGFECEYILILGNEEGKLHSFAHRWNENIKPCKPIRLLSKILGINCREVRREY